MKRRDAALHELLVDLVVLHHYDGRVRDASEKQRIRHRRKGRRVDEDPFEPLAELLDQVAHRLSSQKRRRIGRQRSRGKKCQVRVGSLLQTSGGAALRGNRTSLEGRYDYSKQFRRPDFEVDDRLNSTTRATSARLDQKLWSRWGIVSDFEFMELRYEEGETSQGADPATNRNQDRYRLAFEPRYSLTEKTDLILGADQEWHRFELNTERDSNSNRGWIGFQVSSPTRLSGRLRAGVRHFDFLNLESSSTFPYADVILHYLFGPRTALTARYNLDRQFTFSSNLGNQPTARQEIVEAQVDKGLWANLELRVTGRLRRYRTDDPVRVVVDGTETITIREDEQWSFSVNPAIRIRRLFRLGAQARYVDRRSNISGLSVAYWQYGATFEIVPTTFQ